jgi:membrane-associated protein
LAAVLGDSVNYLFGRMFGEKISRWIKPEYLLKTQDFYDQHGGKTIIIARFMPIIRTFAPFVAGLAKMNTRHFLYFNLIGAFIWVVGLCGAGYLLGNISWVKQNLSIIIWGIILVSISPMIFEFFKVFFRKLYCQK